MRWYRPLWRADRHLVSAYMVYFGLCLACAGALILIGDLAQQFSRFARTESGGALGVLLSITRYYATFVPAFLAVNLLPLLMMVAGILALTRGQVANEHIALRAAGVSLARLAAPALLAALAMGLVFLSVRDVLVPGLLMANRRYQHELFSASPTPSLVVLDEGDARQSAAVGHFSTDARAHNLQLVVEPLGERREDGLLAVVYTADAAYLAPRGLLGWAWLPASPRAAKMRVHEYGIPPEEPWTADEPVPTSMSSQMFLSQTLGNEVLSSRDLDRLASAGEPAARHEAQARRAAPWAGLAVTALGAGISLWTGGRGRRPSYIVNLLAGLGMAGLFMAFQSLLAGVALDGRLSPERAAWLPVAIALAAAAVLFRRAE